MASQEEIARLILAVEEGSEIYQHLDDQLYIQILRDFGREGLEVVGRVLENQVDAIEEAIACYCAHMVIVSRLPGRVGVILEALRWPYKCLTVREDLFDTVCDHVCNDPEFFGDEAFVSETRRLEPKYPWVEEQIAVFLKHAASLKHDVEESRPGGRGQSEVCPGAGASESG